MGLVLDLRPVILTDSNVNRLRLFLLVRWLRHPSRQLPTRGYARPVLSPRI